MSFSETASRFLSAFSASPREVAVVAVSETTRGGQVRRLNVTGKAAVVAVSEATRGGQVRRLNVTGQAAVVAVLAVSRLLRVFAPLREACRCCRFRGNARRASRRFAWANPPAKCDRPCRRPFLLPFLTQFFLRVLRVSAVKSSFLTRRTACRSPRPHRQK